MTLYSYSGPVREFDKEISRNWESQTYAVSEKKARANLVFQFKKQTGREARSKITLPGKLIVEGDDAT